MKAFEFAAVACAALTTLAWDKAAAAARWAQSPSHHRIEKRPAAHARYFVDFRSRPGYFFGHTYIVYGQLDGRGQPQNGKYAGIYPLDGQTGLVVGTIFPVAASVRGVEGDYSEPPSNNYRRELTSAQYARLTSTVHSARLNDRTWHLIFANCNDFAIRVAQRLGLRTPSSMLLPKLFVDELRDLNSP